MRNRAVVASLFDCHSNLHDHRIRCGVSNAARVGELTMRNAVNFVADLIFGFGLLISGMANPAKVQNFLDIAGTFDPSLLFVMLGAVTVTFVGYRLVLRWPIRAVQLIE